MQMVVSLKDALDSIIKRPLMCQQVVLLLAIEFADNKFRNSASYCFQAHARKVDETRTRLTDDERRERVNQLQRTLQLVVHASACNNPQCHSTNCKKVKMLFQHAVNCQKKVTGGCSLCR